MTLITENSALLTGDHCIMVSLCWNQCRKYWESAQARWSCVLHYSKKASNESEE